MIQISDALRRVFHEQMRKTLPATFEERRMAFESGDRSALMEVIFMCAAFQAIPPEWAADALLEVDQGLADGTLYDWNEAFGKQAAVNTRARRAKLINHSHDVLSALVMARLDGLPMNMDGAFVTVAQQLCDQGLPLNAEHVKAIYEQHKEQVLSVERGGSKSDVRYAFLNAEIPLSELRRRGRPFWEG